MATKTEQKVPKWFDGQIYPKGGIVTNPYSGQSCELNALELSIYDYLKGCESMGLAAELGKCLEWFSRNNVEAYYTLLD